MLLYAVILGCVLFCFFFPQEGLLERFFAHIQNKFYSNLADPMVCVQGAGSCSYVFTVILSKLLITIAFGQCFLLQWTNPYGVVLLDCMV